VKENEKYNKNIEKEKENQKKEIEQWTGLHYKIFKEFKEKNKNPYKILILILILIW